MELTCLHNKFNLSALPHLSLPSSKNPNPRFFSRKRNNLCLASTSDTLVTGSGKEVSSKKDAELGDLKSWMHKNGLPPCKVVLKERPSYDEKHRPIHYVAACEDLRAGDVAFSVPNSLVVTLERVLGNETVGKVHYIRC